MPSAITIDMYSRDNRSYRDRPRTLHIVRGKFYFIHVQAWIYGRGAMEILINIFSSAKIYSRNLFLSIRPPPTHLPNIEILNPRLCLHVCSVRYCRHHRHNLRFLIREELEFFFLEFFKHNIIKKKKK